MGRKADRLLSGRRLAIADIARLRPFPKRFAAAQLPQTKRTEDGSGDLWTTFNHVQQTMTKGGVHGGSRTGRRVTTRPINGID